MGMGMGTGDVGFFLVHGGAHDSRCWEPLLPLLDGPAKAIDLPGRHGSGSELSLLRLSDFVDSALADLDAFNAAGHVIVVGHSMAGITIPKLAALRPSRVGHLVFLSCFIPKEGTSVLDGLPLPLRWITRASLPFAGRRSMPPALARRLFCNDMDADQERFALSVLTSEAVKVIREPVSRLDLPAHSDIPRTFIRLSQDRALPPTLQERLIDNLGECDVVTLDSGHNAMISHPRELAAVLNGLALNVSA
ncbi:MAG TPA: alpha/beta fold hydrolase [Acidimicrobiales bacterium]|jgi:pimeloyl-ACP methyl ester carboxylesterase